MDCLRRDQIAVFSEEHVHGIQLNGNAVASNHKGSPMRHTLPSRT